MCAQNDVTFQLAQLPEIGVSKDVEGWKLSLPPTGPANIIQYNYMYYGI